MTYSYRKLLPRERGVFSYSELWTAEDHLLSAASSRLNVQYQRFPLAEIQAISVTTLPHWTWPQILWLAGSGALFALSVWGPSLRWLGYIFGAFTVWPFLLAIRELWLGPRCKTLIHTATGAHPLPAVSRQSRVAEFLATVTPLVEGVQGKAESLAVFEHLAPHPEEVAREQLSADRVLRLFAFGALLLEGFFDVAQWRFPAVARRPDVILVALGLYIAVIAVIATVWRRSTPVLRRDRVYLLVGAILSLALIEFCVSILVGFTASFRPGMDYTTWLTIAGAAWRIPLALTALTLELRRE